MPEYRINRFGAGFALVFERNGKRHRHRIRTTDAREAERLAPALYEELTRPLGSTVEALWRAYRADMAGRVVVGTMEHTWKALKDRFGLLEAAQITITDCRAYIDARRLKGIKDGSIRTELNHLRMVVLWAHKHKLIIAPPYIERPPQPKPKHDYLTKQEARKLLDACQMPHLKMFVHLALGTGARKQAILDLTWDRCDFARGLIDLRDPDMKGPHKGRSIVPMTATVKRALLGIKDGSLSPYVVEWAGKKVASVKKGVANAAERAGIKHVSPHMLRHSAAVHMAEAGVSMDEIAQYLGHGNVSVTRTVYARYSPDHLKTAAKALEYDDEVRLYQGELSLKGK